MNETQCVDPSRSHCQPVPGGHSPASSPEEVLPTLDLDAHLRDPAIKQRFVTAMFDVIARRYDRFTRLFSLGMDGGWKRELIDALAADAAPAVLVDLACGTGDLTAVAARRWPSARVIGVDVSRRMARLAVERLGGGRQRPAVSVADMVRLPFADACVDLVTVGYGIRNAPTPAAALAEIARILRPGGWLLVLDFYRPERRLWGTLFPWYLRAAGSLLGWVWHRTPVAYGYLGPAVARYLTTAQFEGLLGEHGFTVRRASRKLLGGVALHGAVREP